MTNIIATQNLQYIMKIVKHSFVLIIHNWFFHNMGNEIIIVFFIWTDSCFIHYLAMSYFITKEVNFG